MTRRDAQHSPTPEDILRPHLTPEQAERFTDVVLLGHGGMGAVFRARDRELGRVVALKQVRFDRQAEEDAQRRFRREVQIMSRLRHPNVVQFFDLFGTTGPQLLIMEYVEGENLNQLIEAEGALAPARAARLVAAVLDGVSAIHELQVIHRDLKPSNVIVTVDGTAKIVDFGLSAFLDRDRATRLTATGNLVGTLMYMPPELMLGKRHDEQSDIFQTGLMLYEVLTGQQYYSTADIESMLTTGSETPIKRPSHLVPSLPTELDDIVLKALATDTAARYRAAREFAAALRALERAKDHEAVPRQTTATKEPAERQEHLSTKQPAISVTAKEKTPSHRTAMAAMFITVATIAFLVAAYWQRADRSLALEDITIDVYETKAEVQVRCPTAVRLRQREKSEAASIHFKAATAPEVQHFELSRLEPGKKYEFVFFSPQGSITAPPLTVDMSHPVTDLTVAAVTGTAATLSWRTVFAGACRVQCAGKRQRSIHVQSKQTGRTHSVELDEAALCSAPTIVATRRGANGVTFHYFVPIRLDLLIGQQLKRLAAMKTLTRCLEIESPLMADRRHRLLVEPDGAIARLASFITLVAGPLRDHFVSPLTTVSRRNRLYSTLVDLRVLSHWATTTTLRDRLRQFRSIHSPYVDQRQITAVDMDIRHREVLFERIGRPLQYLSLWNLSEADRQMALSLASVAFRDAKPTRRYTVDFTLDEKPPPGKRYSLFLRVAGLDAERFLQIVVNDELRLVVHGRGSLRDYSFVIHALDGNSFEDGENSLRKRFPRLHWSFRLPPDVLHAGSNKLEFTALSSTSKDYMIVAIQQIRLVK